MADEGNIQHPTDSIKRKRSRHLEETKKKLISGVKIIHKDVWSPVQGLFKFFDETGDKKSSWRINLQEKKLNTFWTMPSLW